MTSLRVHSYWLFAIVITYIAVIIFFSSGRNSARRTAPIFVRMIEGLWRPTDTSRITRLYILMRKTAHLGAYGILAFLTSAAFYISGVAWVEEYWQILSFVVVLSIAALDETLQYFDAERVGSVCDVVLDCVGGLAAIILFWATVTGGSS